MLREPGFGIPESEPSRRPTADGDRAALRMMTRSILRANPPDHGRMRSLVGQVFTPRRVAGLRPAIDEAVAALLDRLAEAGADGTAGVDFMDLFAFQLPVTVICELLGIPDQERHPFRALAADLTGALEPAADITDTAEAAARELAGYFTALIAQRRAVPSDDLIGALVAARDTEATGVSETELLANLIMLLVAGFETTTNLLGNGLALLLNRPELADDLRSGEIGVAAFIEEVLRHDSPV